MRLGCSVSLVTPSTGYLGSGNCETVRPVLSIDRVDRNDFFQTRLLDTRRVVHGEFESECPGYCEAQESFYFTTLEGGGRKCRQTFSEVDTYAKMAFAKLTARGEATTWYQGIGAV